MESTVVQPAKVQREPIYGWTFRWQKWMDGNGKLWINVGTNGFDEKGQWGATIDLLDVDNETVIEVKRADFDEWVKTGTLKRIDTPILL